MPKITSIEPQVKAKDRFNIFVDGSFAFAASVYTIVDYRLKENLEIPLSAVEALVKENEYGLLLDRTLRWLGVRPRSEKELLDYLNRPNPKAINPRSTMAISQVIKRVSELGYIDDLVFAKWFVQSRLRSRPRGERLLKLELYQKGIEKDVIDQALNESHEDEMTGQETQIADESALAIRASQRVALRYQALPTIEYTRKMASFLQRRGFSWDTTRAVIDHYRKNE